MLMSEASLALYVLKQDFLLPVVLVVGSSGQALHEANTHRHNAPGDSSTSIACQGSGQRMAARHVENKASLIQAPASRGMSPESQESQESGSRLRHSLGML